MAERRRSAHAGDDQNNGVTLSAKKTRDPQSSYLYRSVGKCPTLLCFVMSVVVVNNNIIMAEMAVV